MAKKNYFSEISQLTFPVIESNGEVQGEEEHWEEEHRACHHHVDYEQSAGHVSPHQVQVVVHFQGQHQACWYNCAKKLWEFAN